MFEGFPKEIIEIFWGWGVKEILMEFHSFGQTQCYTNKIFCMPQSYGPFVSIDIVFYEFYIAKKCF